MAIDLQKYPWLELKPLLCSISLSILIAVIFKHLWSQRKKYLLSLHLPGPCPIPMLGSVNALKEIINKKNVLDHILDYCELYGSPFQFWLGKSFFVVLTNPVDIEDFVSTCHTSWKPKLFYFLSEGIGNGLYTGRGGANWKKHKLILNQAFSTITRKNIETCLNKQSNNLIDKFTIVGSDLVDCELICKRFCADLISETVFGDCESNFQNGQFDDILNGISGIFTNAYERTVKCHLHCPYLYGKKPQYEEDQKYRSLIQSYFLNLYNKRKDEFWKKKDSFDLLNPLNVLIIAQKERGYSESEIIEEMMNIFVSGVESIFSTMGYFILVLGIHKDQQDKLYEEIKNHFSDSYGNDVAIEDLTKLTFLDRCFKETLRLFPVSPVIFKEVHEDFLLDNKKLVIPKGTIIAIPSYFNNRNEEHWVSPNTFDPDRFAPENFPTHSARGYYPFSNGLRTCTGQHVGPDMVKIPLIYLMRNFTFHSDLKMKELKFVYNIKTLKSTIGYKIGIEKRH